MEQPEPSQKDPSQKVDIGLILDGKADEYMRELDEREDNLPPEPKKEVWDRDRGEVEGPLEFSDDEIEPQLKKTKPEEDNVLLERSKFIPLRLSSEERKKLRLLEAALSVSDYTDKVDILATQKSKRIYEQLKDICAILSGLLVASDYTAGQKLITDRDFKENAAFFQEMFEIGRRHKIMNPEKMRNEYGKLVYLIQDSVNPEIAPLMGFTCKKSIRTVYNFLESRNALKVLQDPNVYNATMEIIDDKIKTRATIQKEIKLKEKSVEHIANKYKSSQISDDEIRLCLRSIGDNNSFLRGTRDPIEKMIQYLTQHFDAEMADKGYDLSISYGRGGARLSHSHSSQYHYVYQSLTLWRDITHDMFRLWILAEEDLLDENNRYRLSNTGQGLNRVQQAPRIGENMHKLLRNVQKRMKSWIGSSVIHLGDHNVPNALMFIDKYTQITRIINPIIITIVQIDQLNKDKGLHDYFKNAFGGAEKLKKDILLDFFTHAFDGSGADNFFDAGSCIDGRLTSAWNWCSKLGDKPYFPVFKLAGFVGFDGDFK